jgi:hypothetical protein
MYILLGSSLSFALTYAVLDLATLGFYNCNCFSTQQSLPLIAYPVQVLLLSVNAVILGGIFGLLFGVLEVQGGNEWIRHSRFLEQQFISAPISALMGVIVCVINHRISEDKRVDIMFNPASNRGEGI